MKKFLRASLLMMLIAGVFFTGSLSYAKSLNPKHWVKRKSSHDQNVSSDQAKKELKKKEKAEKKKAKKAAKEAKKEAKEVKPKTE